MMVDETTGVPDRQHMAVVLATYRPLASAQQVMSMVLHRYRSVEAIDAGGDHDTVRLTTMR
jgi:hypothetical protein